MKSHFPNYLLTALFLLVPVISLHAASPEKAEATPIVTRVFFQDDEAKTLKWASLQEGTPPKLSSPQEILGFPKLDPKKQSLVQMAAVANWILVGVRDIEEGKFQSGWVLIDTGVEWHDHGSHSHTHYVRRPSVRAVKLDDKQGNPAHLYVYEKQFFLANDKLDGFTRLRPSQINPQDSTDDILAKTEFFAAGGSHITLAATKSVAYGTWAARDGENVGRVDVIALAAGGKKTPNYSFKLPHGGLHGAIANHGKVFFAPSDGIYWLNADEKLSQSPSTVQIQHISLGKNEESQKPYRTGAFSSWGSHVFCVSGSGADAALWSFDASASAISPQKLALGLPDAHRPSTPVLLKPRKSKSPIAFLFHEDSEESDIPSSLTLVELDPNGDGIFGDAKVTSRLEVGRCLLDGHAGHHELAFDGDRRWGVITNSGDGTLQILSVENLQLVGKIEVGGRPSKVVAVGGYSQDD